MKFAKSEKKEKGLRKPRTVRIFGRDIEINENLKDQAYYRTVIIELIFQISIDLDRIAYSHEILAGQREPEATLKIRDRTERRRE